MSEMNWRWWRWLVESLGESNLLLVKFLQLGDSMMFVDSSEVIFCSVQQSNTDMSLLQSTDVVGSVSAHECSVSHILEAKKDELLLSRGNTSVDPGVANELLNSRLTVEFCESISSDTDILGLKNFRVDWLRWLNWNDSLLINTSPYKF